MKFSTRTVWTGLVLGFSFLREFARALSVILAAVGIVVAGFFLPAPLRLPARLENVTKELEATKGSTQFERLSLRQKRYQDLVDRYGNIGELAFPRSRDSAELREARIRFSGMRSAAKEEPGAVDAQIRQITELEKAQPRKK